VRQNIDEDCAQDQIDDNLRNRAHVSPPNFDDDDRQHNGDQHGHPIDRAEIKLHLFLLFSYKYLGLILPLYQSLTRIAVSTTAISIAIQLIGQFIFFPN
jgi:hypothetical protein